MLAAPETEGGEGERGVGPSAAAHGAPPPVDPEAPPPVADNGDGEEDEDDDEEEQDQVDSQRELARWLLETMPPSVRVALTEMMEHRQQPLSFESLYVRQPASSADAPLFSAPPPLPAPAAPPSSATDEEAAAAAGGGESAERGGSGRPEPTRPGLRREYERLDAANVIQIAWRRKRLGFDAAKYMIRVMGKDDEESLLLTAPPSTKIAREFAEKQLAKRIDPETGEDAPYPLNSPLSAFDSFGVEISSYMRFIAYFGRVSFLVSVLNLGTILSNLDGGHSTDLLAKHSLNNADCLGNSHGILEILTSATLCYFAFWMRRKMFRHTEAITKGRQVANVARTAASTSVRVENCPPEMTADHARKHFRRWGKVLHVGISLDNRELILEINRRNAIAQQVNDAAVNLLRYVREANAAKLARGGSKQTLLCGPDGERLSAVDEIVRASEAAYNERDVKMQVHLRALSSVLSRAVAKLEAHDKVMRRLTTQRHACTGTIFVSFAEWRAAQRCLQHSSVTNFKPPPKKSLEPGLGQEPKARRLRVSPAPPSDQVHWENLQVTRLSRTCRQLLSTFLILMTSLISSLIITSSTYFKVDVDQLLFGNCYGGGGGGGSGRNASAWSPFAPPHPPPSPFAPPSPPPPFLPTAVGSAVSQEYECIASAKAANACELTFFQQLPALLGSTVCIIGGYVAIFIVTPTLATLIERAHYTYERELSVFLKLALFQVFNVLVTMYAALYDPRPEERRDSLRGWLSYASPVIINVLIGDAFIVHLLIDMGRPDTIINRLIKGRWAATQHTLNQLWSVDPDLWLVFRLQLAAKVILLSLMFSSAIPLLHFLTTAYCFIASIVDRYLLFRVIRKPPRADSLRLMYGMVCWLFPFAVLFRLAFSIFVYFGLDCACEKTAFSSDDALGLGSPAPSDAPAAALAAPPSAPLTLLPSAIDGFAAWSANAFNGALASRRFGQLVVLFGSGCMLLFVTFFIAREAVFIICIARQRNHARINRAPRWHQLLPTCGSVLRGLGPLGSCLACCCPGVMAQERRSRSALRAGTFKDAQSGRSLLPADATASDATTDGHSGWTRLDSIATGFGNTVSAGFKKVSDLTQIGLDLIVNSAQENAIEERPPLLGQIGHLDSRSGSYYGSRLAQQKSGSKLARVSEALSDARVSLMSFKSNQWDSVKRRDTCGTIAEEAEGAEGAQDSVKHASSASSVTISIPSDSTTELPLSRPVSRMASFASSAVGALSAKLVADAKAMEVPDDPSREIMYLPPLVRHLLELLAIGNVIESGHTHMRMKSRQRLGRGQRELMELMPAATLARASRLFEESSSSRAAAGMLRGISFAMRMGRTRRGMGPGGSPRPAHPPLINRGSSALFPPPQESRRRTQESHRSSLHQSERRSKAFPEGRGNISQPL